MTRTTSGPPTWSRVDHRDPHGMWWIRPPEGSRSSHTVWGRWFPAQSRPGWWVGRREDEFLSQCITCDWQSAPSRDRRDCLVSARDHLSEHPA